MLGTLFETLQMGQFAGPHKLGAASVAGKPDRESRKRSGHYRRIKTGQDAQLSDPERAGGELAGDASLPQLLAFARRVLTTLCKPMLAEEICSMFLAEGYTILYPISRSSLVLNLKVPHTE